MFRGLARRPRTWLWVGGIIFGLAALANPAILGQVLVFVGLVLGLRWIFRGLRR